jgi:putative phosphoesterase
MVIGLIADTHGLVRPDVAAAFRGVDLILHAGDVGSRDVLAELELIAPVEAVAGNIDPLELGLPATLVREIEGLTVRVTHGHELGSPTPESLASRYGGDLIVFGHTHRPIVRRIGPTLVVNPGAAGPRRFNLVPRVARLTIGPQGVSVEGVALSF